MSAADDEQERRIEKLWLAFDQLGEREFAAQMEALLSTLPPDSARAAFERASVLDSTGHPDGAVPLYRRALELGLSNAQRRRAVIQLASSLRNLGLPQEAVDLLTVELGGPPDELDDAVRAFLALALADVGREREGVALALEALSRHLPRYRRSVVTYARDLAARASSA